MAKKNDNQIEFVDWHSDGKKPPGGGYRVNGVFVYKAEMQTAAQVAYTLQCSTTHVYELIDEGELEGAVDISPSRARRACYRIPKARVLDFIETRTEGAR